jgi:hypothetical protein
MSECTGMASEMAEPTRIVEDHDEWLSQAECPLEWLWPLKFLRLL